MVLVALAASFSQVTAVNRRSWHLIILYDPGSLERDCGCSVSAAHVEAVHLDVNDDKLGFGSSFSTRKCVARAANVASSSSAHDSALPFYYYYYFYFNFINLNFNFIILVFYNLVLYTRYEDCTRTH